MTFQKDMGPTKIQLLFFSIPRRRLSPSRWPLTKDCCGSASSSSQPLPPPCSLLLLQTIAAQVAVDQGLLRERVFKLSGAAGVGRLEAALSEAVRWSAEVGEEEQS